MGEKSKMNSGGARFCPRIAPPYAARGPAPHRRLAPRAHPAVRAIRHLACAELDISPRAAPEAFGEPNTQVTGGHKSSPTMVEVSF